MTFIENYHYLFNIFIKEHKYLRNLPDYAYINKIIISLIIRFTDYYFWSRQETFNRRSKSKSRINTAGQSIHTYYIYCNNIIRNLGCVYCKWRRSEVKMTRVRSNVLLVSKQKRLNINQERERFPKNGKVRGKSISNKLEFCLCNLSRS